MDWGGLASLLGIPVGLLAVGAYVWRDRSDLRTVERVLALEKRKVEDPEVRARVTSLQLEVLNDALLRRRFPGSPGLIYISIGICIAALVGVNIATALKVSAEVQLELFLGLCVGLALEAVAVVDTFFAINARTRYLNGGQPRRKRKSAAASTPKA